MGSRAGGRRAGTRSPEAHELAPGIGLGLAIADRIVRLLGGRIWAADRPEGGAEFGFELPVAEDDGA